MILAQKEILLKKYIRKDFIMKNKRKLYDTEIYYKKCSYSNKIAFQYEKKTRKDITML